MPAAHLAALEDDDTALLATLRQRRPVLEDESARLALAIQKIGEKIKDERAAAKARRASEFGVQHDHAVAAYMQTAKPAMASFDAILDSPRYSDPGRIRERDGGKGTAAEPERPRQSLRANSLRSSKRTWHRRAA